MLICGYLKVFVEFLRGSCMTAAFAVDMMCFRLSILDEVSNLLVLKCG